MNPDDLSKALDTCLCSYFTQDAETLTDLIDLIVNECARAGIACPQSATIASLAEVDDNPLCSLMKPFLSEYLPTMPESSLRLVMGDILDSYRNPQLENEDAFSCERISECELCDRATRLTKHHLIPKESHGWVIKRGLFTRDECHKRLSYLCRPCHSAVHRSKSTRELAIEYNTVEKLLELPDVLKFAQWNSKMKN